MVAAIVAVGIVVGSLILLWPAGGVQSGVELVERPADLVDIRELDWPIGEVGECLVQRGEVLAVIECGEPHDLQRIMVGELGAASLPAVFDAGAVETSARASCESAFATFVGVAPDESELQVAIAVPSAAGWDEDDDRTFQCFLGVAGRRMVGDAGDR